MRWLNWVDRLFRKDFELVERPWKEGEDPYRGLSWAIELAHGTPPTSCGHVRRQVEALVRRAGEAIGMGTQKGGHILKADIMLTTKGPMILELTPRLSGGWDSALSTPERGADFIGGALRLALGEKLDEAYGKSILPIRRPSVSSRFWPRCARKRWIASVVNSPGGRHTTRKRACRCL